MLRILFFIKSFGPGYNNSGVYDAAKYTADFIANEMSSYEKIECLVIPVKNEEEIVKVTTDIPYNFIIIEGIWADPEKITNVPKYFMAVRCHSQWSFMDPFATSLIFKYSKMGVLTIFNEYETYKIFKTTEDNSFFQGECWYLPNVFPVHDDIPFVPLSERSEPTKFKIGMFGELRPMKNHTMQAMVLRRVSKKLYEKYGITTELHINTSLDADPVLNSIRTICFEEGSNLALKEHFWLKGEEFNKVIAEMNLGLQVSFTETFNLTSARFINNGVPVIASTAVSWLPKRYTVQAHSPFELYEAVMAMAKPDNSFFRRVFNTGETALDLERSALFTYVRRAKYRWTKFINSLLG